MLLKDIKAIMENKENESDEVLCRICATSGSGEMFAIYSRQGELWDVAEKIGRCLPVIVLPTDILPLNICSKCLVKLNASYELITTAVNSEAKLRAKFELDYGIIETEEEEEEEDDDVDDYVGVRNESEFVEVKEERDSEKQFYKSMSEERPAASDKSRNHRDTKKGHQGISTETDNSPEIPIYGPATCDICNVTFIDMDKFDEHVENEHLQKFCCSCCDASFEQSEDLLIHKATEHYKEPVSCIKCLNKKEQQNPTDEGMDEEWLEEVEFYIEEHNEVKSNGTEGLCQVCGKYFENEKALKDHSSKNVSARPMCNLCSYSCSSVCELHVHKKMHFGEAIVCDVCNKSFADRIRYNLHRKSCLSKQYVCNICNRVFWKKLSLQLHMKKEGSYECSCGRKFHSLNSLAFHKKTHDTQGVMKCVTCNKVFTNENFYKRHRYIHDPEYWDRFKCHICRRPFRDAHALKNHMQLHDGVKPHKCDVCGRTYNRYANMVKHRRLHKPQNQWEHTCNHCQAKFERLKDLMVHIDQAHLEGGNKEEYTGDKKWICRFCGKRISTKLSLQDHERIHTGAKPFMCEWCGREFRSRPNLLQHHLTHTGDRKHECEICKKRFARKSFITQHMRVHTGEKPYECDLCGKRFTQAGDMKRHRNRHLKPLEQGLSFYVQLQQ